MPAPTALLQPPAEPENIPLPPADQDEGDELLLDAPNADLSVTNAIQTTGEAEDTEMVVVDEEGRPRFAPAKDSVGFSPPSSLQNAEALADLPALCLGSGEKGRD